MFSLSDIQVQDVSNELIRVDNVLYPSIQLINSNDEFITRLFTHLPFMKDFSLIDHNMIMSGKLVAELALFENQDQFFKPKSFIELYLFNVFDIVTIKKHINDLNDTVFNNKENLLNWLLNIKKHCVQR